MERMPSGLERAEKKEEVAKMPIIDIIRHGKSRYKEYFDKDFEFNQDSESLPLDEENLDITNEGIAELEETARQIEMLIDKENEVVLLVTSPSARAQSSLLVMRKYLEKQGIGMLNPDKIYKTRQLRPLDLKDIEKDKDEFIRTTAEYAKEVGGLSSEPTDKIKEEIARRMDREFGDLFAEESFDNVNGRFKRFVRHMTNINQNLSDGTKEIIGNKQLRVLCLSHEELPVRFLREAYGEDSKLNLQNGQIFEIRPSGSLGDGTMHSSVALYSKGAASTMNADVEIKL